MIAIGSTMVVPYNQQADGSTSPLPASSRPIPMATQSQHSLASHIPGHFNVIVDWLSQLDRALHPRVLALTFNQ